MDTWWLFELDWPFYFDYGDGSYDDSYTGFEKYKEVYPTNSCVMTNIALTNYAHYEAEMIYTNMLLGAHPNYPDDIQAPTNEVGDVITIDAEYHKTNGVWGSSDEHANWHNYPVPGSGADILESGYTPTSRRFVSETLHLEGYGRNTSFTWQGYDQDGPDLDYEIIFVTPPDALCTTNKGGTITYDASRPEQQSRNQMRSRW